MHLTACWCWGQTDPDTLEHHLMVHQLHEIIERCNIELIALEVAYWPSPTNRKESK